MAQPHDPSAPHLSNQVLAALPAAEMDWLLRHSRAIELPQEMIVFEAGEEIERVFFPHSGVFRSSWALRRMIEAAMIGRKA